MSFFNNVQKKVTFLKCLKSQKIRASPSDTKEWESKKKFDLSFFLGMAGGNVWIQNFWKKVVFSSNFTRFSLFLRHAQWIVIFFRFFCYKQ